MAQEANALALLKRLEAAGYTPTIRKGGGSVTRHVVLVATPLDRTEADAVLERLRAEGVSGRILESEGSYRIEAGRSIALDEAIDLARDLQGKGFTTRIDSKTVGATLYLVRVGNFMSLAEARRTGQELREKGFPVLIVKK
jgi:cell division septation protein DedD